MKKIILGKGEGKTYELIKISANSGNYIVCHNQREASRIQSEALKMDLKIPFPLTYDEFLDRKYYGKGVNGFLIDNVDMLMDYLSGTTPITAFTLTV